MASLAHLAIHDEATVAEVVEVVAKRVDGDIHRARDGPGGVLGLGAHVDEGPTVTDQAVELAGGHDVAVAAQDILGHVSEHVDRILGRRERRRIGKLQVREPFR